MTKRNSFVSMLDMSSPGPVAGFGGDIVDWEIEVTCTYEYTPERQATGRTHDSLGSPPEPATVDILSVVPTNAVTRSLPGYADLLESSWVNARQMAELERLAMEHAENSIAAEREGVISQRTEFP